MTFLPEEGRPGFRGPERRAASEAHGGHEGHGARPAIVPMVPVSNTGPVPMPTAAAAAYAEFFPLIADKMVKVEREYASWLGSDVDVLARASAYLSETGGKRLRPALLLLCSGLTGYRAEHDVLFAAVFEFIHTATLVHDDIIDEAEVRRGRPSLNRVYGNDLSVLVGDHLYLKAMKMALKAGDLRLIDLLADVTLKMIEGEIIQTHVNGRLDVTEEQVLQIIDCKTARLFSACCQVPAALAESGPEIEETLAGFGRDLGMAFQMIDDLLDITSDEKVLGKPVGDDLKQGKLTLPLIRLLKLGVPSHRELISQVLADGSFGRTRRGEIREILDANGILEATRDFAIVHAESARARLQIFPDSPFRRALQRVTQFVVSRDR